MVKMSAKDDDVFRKPAHAAEISTTTGTYFVTFLVHYEGFCFRNSWIRVRSL